MTMLGDDMPRYRNVGKLSCLLLGDDMPRDRNMGILSCWEMICREIAMWGCDHVGR